MSGFSEAKAAYDKAHATASILPNSFVPVDGAHTQNIRIRNSAGEALEEYYKWQFIYGLTQGGLVPKDYIGTEVRFPKGNKTSAPLKVDAVIFDHEEWLAHYLAFWKTRATTDLEWLASHILAVIEFKKDDREVEKVFTGQIKPAMREKEPSDSYVVGMYYDAERLYLFHRRNGLILRYDESKNQKGDESGVGDLYLHLPDPYLFLPSLSELKQKANKAGALNRSGRGLGQLETITSIATVQIKTALSNVLRTLDKAGLVNQRGYQILIEAFALKIFDEKRNERNAKKTLEFYVDTNESHFAALSDKPIQGIHQTSPAAEIRSRKSISKNSFK